MDDALKVAIKKRRFGKLNPIDYQTEENADMEAMQQEDADEASGAMVNQKHGDVAPELQAGPEVEVEGMADQVIDPMIAHEEGEIEGEAGEMENDADQIKRLESLMEPGVRPGKGIRGKAMSRIRGVLDKLKA